METYEFGHEAASRLPGTRTSAIAGVVASGNLEVLLERNPEGARCEITVVTPVSGFEPVWRAVVRDFVERHAPGGLRISINDGGARPDTVSLRLAQGVRLMTTP